MLKHRAWLGVLPVFLVFVCSVAFGQANGTFSGTVVDKTGSVISGATVTATSQSTGLVRAVKTNESGHYLIPLLPVSTYTIQVASTGFQTTAQKNLELQVNESREVNFTLAPGAVTENVDVTANGLAVESTNPWLGQVIYSHQVA